MHVRKTWRLYSCTYDGKIPYALRESHIGYVRVYECTTVYAWMRECSCTKRYATTLEPDDVTAIVTMHMYSRAAKL
jgi:hypothetical protein